MPRCLPLSVLLLTGCLPTFDSFEEACMDRTPGQGAFASEEAPAVKMVHRVNCWRRLARTRRARVEKQLSDSADAHANYVDLNGFDATGGGLFEDPSLPGYTGDDPISRGEAFGYDWGASHIAFWESVSPDGDLDAESYADWLLHEPTGRQIVLQPGLHGIGFGRSGEWIVSDWHYDWPINAHTERPVIWPIDGATNVPIAAPYYDAQGEARWGGYAVTASVGSDQLEGLELANPFRLELVDSAITGPDGAVQTRQITPDSAVYPFPYTVAVVPVDPLEPNTTYEVLLDIAWDDEAKVLEWSFTTGETEVGL